MGKIIFSTNLELYFSGATHQILFEADAPPVYTLWDGLTSYYDFVDATNGSNVLDRKGTNDADSVYIWAVSWGTFTSTNAYFSAANQNFRVTIPSATANSFTGSFSVSAFINSNYVNGIPSETIAFVKYDNAGYDEINYGIYYNYSGAAPTQLDSISFKAKIDGTLRTLTTADVGTPTVNWTPRNVVGTYDSAVGMKLYINGVLKESNSYTGSVAGANAGILCLGNQPSTDANYFDGCIDELALWNRALSAEHVTELYNGGTGKFYT
jgi:hypothetical protein